jgi:hypothetical protein
MNLLKMTILPRFRARARPGLKYFNIFWAEKLVLTGNYPTDFVQKRGKKLFSLHVWINQLTLPWFLEDQIHFSVPGLPVDRFSSVKKHFFIITYNVKGFYCVSARPTVVWTFKSHLQANWFFALKISKFKALGAGSNVVQMTWNFG